MARTAGHRVRTLAAGHVEAGVEVVAGDLADSTAVRSLVNGADVLVHLAAVGVQVHERDMHWMALVNAVQPLALLDAAKRAKVSQVVLAGTCLEYSGHGWLPDAPVQGAPLCTEDSPTEPMDPYGATKAAGGVLQRARARQIRLPCWYLRFASMYGPGDDPEKLVPGLVQRAAAGEPYESTPGEQVREWLHVDDGARALLAAATAKPPDSVTTLNIGTGEGQRIVDVVSLVYSLAGAAEPLVRAGAKPYRGHEVHRLVMDVSRAEQALGGWRASIALREGLAALVGEVRAARER